MNANRYQPKIVTLIDGRQVSDDSEEWRHECEARAIIKMPLLSQRRAYLYGKRDEHGEPYGGILQQRGQAAVERLEETIKRIWYSSRAPE